MGKEDNVNTWFLPTVGTVVVEKQGIKTWGVSKQDGFWALQSNPSKWEREENKPSPCNAWKGKEEVKAIALPAKWEKGASEDKMFKLLRWR